MSIASELGKLQQAKADLETSIEAKGVNVPVGTKLDAYPALVDTISTSSVLTGDAAVGEVLASKTFYSNDPASKLTGTMVNRGEVDTDITAVAQSVTIAQGYHNGSGTVQIAAADQAKLIAGNIKSGVTVLGVAGSIVDYTADYINILDGSGDVMALPEGLTELIVASVALRTNLKMSGWPSTWNSVNIATTAFDACTGITITTVPSMVTTLSRSAFRGCTSIPSMALPVSVTTFADTVFQSCTSMTAFSAPGATNYNSVSLLAGCTALQTVELGSVGKAVTIIRDTTFTGDTQVGLTITIYVTPGAQPLANSPWGATNATIVYHSSVDGSIL